MSKDRLLSYIKEMSQAEKRYFKQTLRQYSNNSQLTIYARLFDYLSKVDVIDKEKLLKKCPYISPNQLQNIKVRLYNRLLQSNRLYYASSDENIEVYQYLIDYEILKKKRLYEQCFSVLVKAEKRANHLGAYAMLKQIFEHQKYLLEVRLKGKKNKALLTKVLSKIDGLSELNKSMISLTKLEVKIYNLFKAEGRILRDKNLAEEALKDFKVILSTAERFIHHQRWSILFNYQASLLYRLTGELDKSEIYLKHTLSIFEKNKRLQKTFSLYYFKTLNLAAIIYNSLRDSEKTMQAIDEMRAYDLNTCNDKDLSLLIFENANFQELEVYLQSRKFDKAVTLSEKIIDELDIYESDIHTVNEFSKYYRIALAYFGNRNYKTALRWVNRIINFDEVHYRKDILSSVQILNLMIHYELKNYDLVLNKLNATIRYLKKIGRYLGYEKIILSGLRSLSTSSSKQKKLKLMLTELEDNQINNPLEFFAMQYFDSNAWIKSKIN